MKTRTGFVSNSSSSSFIIDKDDLTRRQIASIFDHIKEAEDWGISVGDMDFEWTITERKNIIKGYVSMDNFNMSEFFDKIKIPDNVVNWSD